MLVAVAVTFLAQKRIAVVLSSCDNPRLTRRVSERRLSRDSLPLLKADCEDDAQQPRSRSQRVGRAREASLTAWTIRSRSSGFPTTS
jgi:hypothetical protein